MVFLSGEAGAKMHVLVTAGATVEPVDRDRLITQARSGRTGCRIAAAFSAAGHTVRLLTNSPERAVADSGLPMQTCPGLEVRGYRTLDELRDQMAVALRPGGGFQALMHAASVGDYHCAGVYRPATPGGPDCGPQGFVAAASGAGWSEPELWLRLVRAPDLSEMVRTVWGFTGVMAMFAGRADPGGPDRAASAEPERQRTGADLIVAHTAEGEEGCAWLGPVPEFGGYRRLGCGDLPSALRRAVEQLAGAAAR